MAFARQLDALVGQTSIIRVMRALATDQGMDHAENLLDHRDRFSDDASEYEEERGHATTHQ